MLIRSIRWLGKCPFESATWRSLVTLTWVISLQCGGRKTDYKVQKALFRKEKKIVSLDSSFEEFCSKGNRKVRWNLKADMRSGKILIYFVSRGSIRHLYMNVSAPLWCRGEGRTAGASSRSSWEMMAFCAQVEMVTFGKNNCFTGIIFDSINWLYQIVRDQFNK